MLVRLALAVLEAVVGAHDPQRGLTRLIAGAWEIWAPLAEAPAPGQPARAFILARDVMLARERPQRISARNILAGHISSLTAQPGGEILVAVEAPGARLLAALTADSVADLALAPGTEVWAVVKSVAIDGAAGGLLEAIEG